jgi:FkbM family methyltransferase
MQKLRDSLTFNSQLQYLLWRSTGSRYDLAMRLATGANIVVRKSPAQDLNIAYEIFRHNIYQCPKQLNAKNIKTIVDVGANVGYSCLYWLHHFPEARVIAFEPHPEHIKQIEVHLQINRVTERVTLFPSAAGTKVGELFLADKGPESTLLASSNSPKLSVPVVDWFSQLGNQPIDLLKMDIEGSEYPLLADSRFSNLRIETCVLEWHQTPDYPDGRKWCIDRLSHLGYSVVPGKLEQECAGLLWAFRQDCI